MKVILIHGIGDHQPGWSAALQADQVLDVPAKDIVEFTYEDLMENNWLNRLLVMGARLGAGYYAGPAAGLLANATQEYLDDILTYFVAPGVRFAIMSRLITLLENTPNSIVVGFSLGSVVAYETLKNHPECARDHVLITLGSPLGSPSLKLLVRRFLSVPDFRRPEVLGWFNLYSGLDVISGRIDGLGCVQSDQFRIKAFHDFAAYLYHAKKLLPQVFP